MMIVLRFALLAILVCPFDARSQFSATTAEIATGFSYIRQSSSLQSALGLPGARTLPNYAYAPSFAAEVGQAILTYGDVVVRADGGLRYTGFAWDATESTVFNRGGVAVPGSFQHNVSGWWVDAGLGVTFSYRIRNWLDISAAWHARLPVASYARALESIVSPDGIQYTAGGRERTRNDGAISDLIVGSIASARLSVPLSSSLVPYLEYARTTSSLTSLGTASMDVFALGVTIPVNLYRGEADSSGIVGQSSRLDSTTLPVLTSWQQRNVHGRSIERDVPVAMMLAAPSRPCGFLGSVVSCKLKTSGNTSSASVRVQRLIRISPRWTSPDTNVAEAMGIDSLRSVVVIDTAVIADPPTALVTVSTRAVEGIQEQYLYAHVHGRRVWTHRIDSTSATVQYSLSTLPVEVIQHDTVRLEISSQVLDNCKGEFASKPVSIVLVPASFSRNITMNIRVDLIDDKATIEKLLDQLKGRLQGNERFVAYNCKAPIADMLRKALGGVSFKNDSSTASSWIDVLQGR